jgi:hypothetical protein
VVELQHDVALPPTSPAMTAWLQRQRLLLQLYGSDVSGSEGSDVSDSDVSGSDGSGSESGVAKPEPHHVRGSGAVTRCGSDVSGSKLNVHHR